MRNVLLRIFLLVFLVGVLCAGHTAQADEQLVDGSDPQVILKIAKGFGSARLAKDSLGDPMIRGKIDGMQYLVLFYGCKNAEECDSIQFRASWSQQDIEMEALNEWNKANRFGKGYLDANGDPTLEMTVNLKWGVSPENLENTFEWWEIIVKDFMKDIIDE